MPSWKQHLITLQNRQYLSVVQKLANILVILTSTVYKSMMALKLMADISQSFQEKHIIWVLGTQNLLTQLIIFFNFWAKYQELPPPPLYYSYLPTDFKKSFCLIFHVCIQQMNRCEPMNIRTLQFNCRDTSVWLQHKRDPRNCMIFIPAWRLNCSFGVFW